MAKTIIQTIGPLYGDVVNGTVFGRPNGSIFVPAVNNVTISLLAEYQYVTVNSNNRYIVCNSAGVIAGYKVVAESQDTQSYLATYLEDEDGVKYGAERATPAGSFNNVSAIVCTVKEDDPALVADQTYYFVAVLYSASGVPVATARQAVKGVVAE